VTSDVIIEKTVNNKHVYGLHCVNTPRWLRVVNVENGLISHLIGIRKGWRITSINDNMPSQQKLEEAIGNSICNQGVSINLCLRGNKNRCKHIGLPVSEPFRTLYSRRKQKKVWGLAGFSLGFCVDTDYFALYIKQVKHGSRAERSGLSVYDRIISVNDMPIYTPDGFFEKLFNSKIIGIKIRNASGNTYTVRMEKAMLLPDAEQLGKEKAAMDSENIVSDELSKLGDDYCELRSIILPLSSRQGTEIDHILIGPKGIFVIETKCLSGYVMGCDKDKYWVQSTGKFKRKIFNPVWQNKYHVRAIKRILSNCNIKVPIISIVVMVGGDVRVDSNTHIVSSGMMLDVIGNHPDILNKMECLNIVSAIKSKEQRSFYGW